MATYNVTNNSNSGTGSLRNAIALANGSAGADTITFDSGLTGMTITLTTGELAITDEVYIDGLGAGNLAISGNNASRVFNINDGTGTVIDVTLEGLTITGGSTSGNGGGIYDNERLTLLNSTISNNTAVNYGGGISGANSSIITNSTISDNSAIVAGGINGANSSTITNSTISDNSSTFGGGGINGANSSTITNSTISDNSASVFGGGIIGANSAVIGNTIIAGNTAGAYSDIRKTGGSITSQGYNLVGSGDVSDFNQTGDVTGITPAQLNLGPLQDNGGPTFTHALLSGSSAINAGSNALATGLTTDQRGAGYDRISDTTVDIGAYEVQALANPLEVTNTNDSGTGSLREAIAFANSNAGLDTITFDNSLMGTTITLTSGELAITDEVYIDGLGANNLAVSGNNASRVFNINDGTGTVIDVTLEGLTITGGSTSGDGGGILDNERLTLLNSTISNNGANNGGGIFGADSATILNGTISNNSAATYGGGIVGAYSAVITNSTISNNSAANFGGGIFGASSAVITNSTISNNSAANFGGGIFGASSAVIGNTIIAGNTAGTYSDIRKPSGNINSQGYNLVGSGDVADFNQTGDVTAITPAQLNLGPLQDNGGPTFTHALLSGSSAINAGSNALATGLTTDQRGLGFPRILDTTVDIGAYEFIDPLTVTLTVINTNDSGVGSLRNAIAFANSNAGTDTITFDNSLIGTTITLTTGELAITDHVYIDGLGDENIAVSGNNASRVFHITDGTGTFLNVTIEGLTITGGSTSGYGGGIFDLERLTLLNSTISGNRANDGGGIAGASSGTIVNSTISNNTAVNGGGGISGAISSTIVNSTISGNSAIGGGGIFGADNATILNSTISGNSASSIGGIGGASSITILNSTISGNSASTIGGIFGASSAVIGNTIIAGNTAVAYSDIRKSGGSITSQGYNLVGSGDVSDFNQTGDVTGITPAQLNLGPLQDNGGATFTHALLSGSSAINAGSNALATGLTTDQRGLGFPRILDTTVDIGAYEFIDPLIVFNPNDSGTGSLREAIAFANNNAGTDTITFDNSLIGTTITLTSGELAITDNLSLSGTNLTIQQTTANSRVFNINDGNNSNLINVSLEGLTITGVSTISNGGGIFSRENLTIENSTITGNTAKNGGGIISSGTLNIINSTLSGNRALNRGGAIFGATGTTNISYSTLSGNSAASRGGAINDSSNTTNITNSTISGNSSTKGGGIFERAGSLTVLNSTIYSNTSTLTGRGIYSNATNTISIGNSILYGSTGTNDLFATNVINNGNNAIGTYNSALNGTFVNNDLVAINPMLGTLQNNGGNTLTHAILSGSPLINSGNNTLANNANLLYDQRGSGFDRILNTTVDIGSFESNFI